MKLKKRNSKGMNALWSYVGFYYVPDINVWAKVWANVNVWTILGVCIKPNIQVILKKTFSPAIHGWDLE